MVTVLYVSIAIFPLQQLFQMFMSSVRINTVYYTQICMVLYFTTFSLHSLSMGIQGPLEIAYLIDLALTVFGQITLQTIDNYCMPGKECMYMTITCFG